MVEIFDLDMIHFDHFIPYSVDKLKERSLSNLVPVCKYCNRSKWDEPFTSWYKEQVFYNKVKEIELLNYVSTGQLVPFFINSKSNAVLNFIMLFQTPQTIALFTNGMCYYFYVILKSRFPTSNMYV